MKKTSGHKMKIEEIIQKHVTSGKSLGISVGLINKNDVQTFNYGEIEKKIKYYTLVVLTYFLALCV